MATSAAWEERDSRRTASGGRRASLRWWTLPTPAWCRNRHRGLCRNRGRWPRYGIRLQSTDPSEAVGWVNARIDSLAGGHGRRSGASVVLRAAHEVALRHCSIADLKSLAVDLT